MTLSSLLWCESFLPPLSLDYVFFILFFIFPAIGREEEARDGTAAVGEEKSYCSNAINVIHAPNK